MCEHFHWPKKSAGLWLWSMCMMCEYPSAIETTNDNQGQTSLWRLLQAAILLNVPLPNLWAQSLLFYEKWDNMFFYTFSDALAKYSYSPFFPFTYQGPLSTVWYVTTIWTCCVPNYTSHTRLDVKLMNAENHDQLGDVTWVECIDENFEHNSCCCYQILPMISSIEFC